MDAGKYLTAFLQVASANGLHKSHISLYAAVLVCFTISESQNPFRVSRRKLMKHSGIQSFATYHECMKDLVLHGFINYQPSYHPQLASQISLR